ncbi:MAG: MFS transporter [Chloroflexi bacterium]|nr:MFS transporter [Chloroflexota bacterium]
MPSSPVESTSMSLPGFGSGSGLAGSASFRKYVALAVLSLTTFVIFLDGTVVNTALPSIARDFSANNSVLQWVVNMYSLILAGFLPVAGSAGDRFGRKKTLASGMLIFGVASVGAALAQGSVSLIAMRGLQGFGAAFALPATLSIIADVFPRGERERAIAIWTAVGSLGIVVGPALGGYLVNEFDWSAVFWLHIPVVTLAIVGLRFVPESRDERRVPLDIPGAALATTGLLAFVFGIIQGEESGWTSPLIVAAFVAGLTLLTAFAVVETRSSHPMLPFEFFKRKDFTGSFVVLLLLMFGMVGVFFFLTQFFQLVQGRSALVAGLALTPVAATMMMGAGIATKAVPKLGPKTAIVIAGLIILSGMGVFSTIEVDTAMWVPMLAIALFGLGAGIAFPTVTDSIMASVPLNKSGVGSAMNDLSRELGITLGVAVLGSLVASLYRNDVKDAVKGLVSTDDAQTVGDSLGSLQSVTANLSPEAAVAVSDAANQTFVDALNVGFLAAAGFIVVAIVVAVVMVPSRSRSTQVEAGESADSDRASEPGPFSVADFAPSAAD